MKQLFKLTGHRAAMLSAAVVATSLFWACGENPEGTQTGTTPSPTGPTEYKITLVTAGGTGYATAFDGSVEDGMVIDRAEAGDEVTLLAEPDFSQAGKGDVYEFVQWSSSSTGVTITEPTKLSTTFTMPAGNVVVKAQFKTSVQHAIRFHLVNNGSKFANAIWNGFMVHNAPKNAIVTLQAVSDDAQNVIWSIEEGAENGAVLVYTTGPTNRLVMPDSDVLIRVEWPQ